MGPEVGRNEAPSNAALDLVAEAMIPLVSPLNDAAGTWWQVPDDSDGGHLGAP